MLKLGSLFDGSGGFPLAGLMVGIAPVWASEIEPFPIRVTTKRIPGMAHYGNVCQLKGSELEPVDIITFGSPCQDLSMASKPKTDKQIIKWLKNPHTDSAEYKMWGNGVALPCVRYILEKIKEHDDDITGLSEQVHQG